MTTEQQTLERCQALLEQAIVLVEMIDDEVFAEKSNISPHGSIGTHLRHILGFYQSFISGLESGRVDYNQRPRDRLLELDRRYTLNTIEATIAGLNSMTKHAGAYPLLVAAEQVDKEITVWCHSTFLRELDFLQSHTIHHYSLIAMLLRLRGIDPGPEFGVAPSTLNYWREEAVCVP